MQDKAKDLYASIAGMQVWTFICMPAKQEAQQDKKNKEDRRKDDKRHYLRWNDNEVNL